MINNFNIRVYACVIKDGKVLVLHEEYAGDFLVKFPGGGLEYGESVIDCLHREFLEELNVKIENISHFYTQEDFVISKFRPDEQLLTLYYLAEILDESEFLIMDNCIEKAEWLTLQTEGEPLNLPVDKIVFKKLQKKFL
ncbi:NUDIX domain-containing protein [Halpernia sp. GG3]